MSTKRKGSPRPGARAGTQVAPAVDESAAVGDAVAAGNDSAAVGDAVAAGNDETRGTVEAAGGEVAGAAATASKEWAIPSGVAAGQAPENGVVWPEGAVGGGFGVPAGGSPPRRELSPELARVAELSIVIGGAVVATLLAAVLAIIEAFYSPLRIGGVLVPVSLVLALATNPLLVWFASSTTKRRMMALLPAGAWCIVWVLAAGRTSEGDMVVTQNDWVGLLTLFAGPLAFAVTIYVASVRRLPAVVRPDGAQTAKKGSKAE